MTYGFGEIVRARISLFDELLQELGRPTLLGDSGIDVDWQTANEHYLRFDLSSLASKSIEIIVSIEFDSLRVDIGGLPECFEWTAKEIDTNPDSIMCFFRQLLTSYLLVETCGNPDLKTRLYLFDEDGHLLKKLILRGFIHRFSGWNCDKRLFLPIIREP